jgi:hypothetical protein
MGQRPKGSPRRPTLALSSGRALPRLPAVLVSDHHGRPPGRRDPGDAGQVPPSLITTRTHGLRHPAGHRTGRTGLPGAGSSPAHGPTPIGGVVVPPRATSFRACAVRSGSVGPGCPESTGRVPPIGRRSGCPFRQGHASRSGRGISGITVSRSLLASVMLSLALVAAMVPAVLADDPTPSGSAAPSASAPGVSAPPSDPAPSASATPPDDGTPPDGDISVDPTFITQPPSRGVLGATGKPGPTLPPTDTIVPTPDVGGATLPALLATLAVFSSLLLVVGRLHAARHR